MTIKKEVEFKGKTYEVEYFYKTFRSMSTQKEHCLALKKAEENEITDNIVIEWIDSASDRKSIIEMTKVLIESYLRKKESLNDKEENAFIEWDGKLD